MFRKTKMCKFHLLGACSRGSFCAFAHTQDELESLPDLSCTKMCRALAGGGFCRDPACRYAHSAEELRGLSEVTEAAPTTPDSKKSSAGWQEHPQAIPNAAHCPVIPPMQPIYDNGMQQGVGQVTAAPAFQNNAAKIAAVPMPMGYPFSGNPSDAAAVGYWPETPTSKQSKDKVNEEGLLPEYALALTNDRPARGDACLLSSTIKSFLVLPDSHTQQGGPHGEGGQQQDFDSNYGDRASSSLRTSKDYSEAAEIYSGFSTPDFGSSEGCERKIADSSNPSSDSLDFQAEDDDGEYELTIKNTFFEFRRNMTEPACMRYSKSTVDFRDLIF